VLFVNLTPYIPLSLRRRGGKVFLEEGLTPLLDTPKSKRVLEAKPLRAGGWERRNKFKTARETEVHSPYPTY